jgi:hypothetical protein
MYWHEWERLLAMIIKTKRENGVYVFSIPRSLKGERRWKRGAYPRGKR